MALLYAIKNANGSTWLKPKRKDMTGFWSDIQLMLDHKNYYVSLFLTQKKAEVYLNRLKNSPKPETRHRFANVTIHGVEV